MVAGRAHRAEGPLGFAGGDGAHLELLPYLCDDAMLSALLEGLEDALAEAPPAGDI